MTDAQLKSRSQSGEPQIINLKQTSAYRRQAPELSYKDSKHALKADEPRNVSPRGNRMNSLHEGSPDEVMFLRLPEVKTVTGLSKSSLYALIRSNSFPAPVHLGPRTVAWVRSEINQWAAERVLTSRSAVSHPGNKKMPQRALGQPWIASKRWA
jgi:prophage regulatory protein